MEHLCKIVVIGCTGVGKSALLRRYTDNDFLDSYISTIGVDFKIKTVKVGDKTTRLHLWDTAGQCRFRTIISSYYRGAHGVILVYDITNYDSFKELEYWLAEIQKYNTGQPLIYVIGNKVDLNRCRTVPREKAVNFCKSHGFHFIEASAKSGEGVEIIFKEITMNIIDQYGSTIETRPVVPLNIKSVPIPKPRKCRC